MRFSIQDKVVHLEIPTPHYRKMPGQCLSSHIVLVILALADCNMTKSWFELIISSFDDSNVVGGS
jgi:hypothetical protein